MWRVWRPQHTPVLDCFSSWVSDLHGLPSSHTCLKVGLCPSRELVKAPDSLCFGCGQQ